MFAPCTVTVTAEDVRPASNTPTLPVARKQVAVGANVRRADGVLRAAHAPDERGRTHLRECLRDLLHLLAGDAGDPLASSGVHFATSARLIHAVNTLGDEFLVFPAVAKV